MRGSRGYHTLGRRDLVVGTMPLHYAAAPRDTPGADAPHFGVVRMTDARGVMTIELVDAPGRDLHAPVLTPSTR